MPAYVLRLGRDKRAVLTSTAFFENEHKCNGSSFSFEAMKTRSLKSVKLIRTDILVNVPSYRFVSDLFLDSWQLLTPSVYITMVSLLRKVAL